VTQARAQATGEEDDGEEEPAAPMQTAATAPGAARAAPAAAPSAAPAPLSAALAAALPSRAQTSALSRMSAQDFGALYSNPNTRPLATALMAQATAGKNVEVVHTDSGVYLVDKDNPARSQKLFGAEETGGHWMAPEDKPPGMEKTPIWVSSKGEAKAIGVPGTQVTIDQKQELEESKLQSTNWAKRMEKLSEQGQGARADIALTQELQQLGDQVTTGPAAALQGWLSDRGIKVGDNVSAIEAYKAIINKMVPEQRVPGSGSTSDYEDKMFRGALPSLMNTRGGNATIQGTIMALAKDKAARAQIADQYMAGLISKADAYKQLYSQPDPYEQFKAFAKQGLNAPNPDDVQRAKKFDAGVSNRRAVIEEARTLLNSGRNKPWSFSDCGMRLAPRTSPTNLFSVNDRLACRRARQRFTALMISRTIQYQIRGITVRKMTASNAAMAPIPLSGSLVSLAS
jgi:hypothetical protein